MSTQTATKIARARSLERVVAVARTHWLFLLMLVSGAVMRVIVSLAYQPALLLVRDAHAYLRRAVELDLSPTVFRPMVYPLLIKPLLAIGGVGLVPLMQHLAGLAMAVLIYLLLVRLGCTRVLAAVGTVPVLFEGFQLNVEHFVLAETFFELMIVGALVLLAWSDRPSLAAVGSAGALIALAGLTRYVGVLVIVPVLVYVLVRRMGWARLAVLLAAFVIPIGAYSYWAGQASGEYGVTSKNGFFLYGRVASFADCAEFDVPRDLQRFCFEIPPSERPVSRGVWGLEPELTGFDIRNLFNAPDANAKLLRFSLTAIRNQPLGYAEAVAKDVWRFYEPIPPQAKEHNVRTWRFPRSLEEVDAHPFVVANEGGPPPELGFDDSFRIDSGLSGFMRSYQNVIYAQGLILLLMTVLGLAGVAAGRKTREKGERSLRAESFLFVGAALVLLVGAVTNTVYHFRYVIPAIPLLGPAAALGAGAIWSRVQGLRERSGSPA